MHKKSGNQVKLLMKSSAGLASFACVAAAVAMTGLPRQRCGRLELGRGPVRL